MYARSYLWLSVASAENKIGDEGAKALADALKSNASLKTLMLYGEHGGRGGEGSRKERGGRDSESFGTDQGRRPLGKGDVNFCQPVSARTNQRHHHQIIRGRGECTRGCAGWWWVRAVLTCGCAWHLQATRLEMKVPRPWQTRSRQTSRSRCWTLTVSMAGGEGREVGKGGMGERVPDRFGTGQVKRETRGGRRCSRGWWVHARAGVGDVGSRGYMSGMV